jgi:hypothetical protein
MSPGWGASRPSRQPGHEEATWTGGQPPGAHPVPSHPPHQLMIVSTPPPPFTPLTRTCIRTSRMLWNAGDFMALCGVSPGSFDHLPTHSPVHNSLRHSLSAPKCSVYHLPAHSPVHVSLRNSLSAPWCSLPWAPSSGLSSSPSSTLAFGMPRPRGKPKWGLAWYEARGRKLSTPDLPSEVELPPQPFNQLTRPFTNIPLRRIFFLTWASRMRHLTLLLL